MNALEEIYIKYNIKTGASLEAFKEAIKEYSLKAKKKEVKLYHCRCGFFSEENFNICPKCQKQKNLEV